MGCGKVCACRQSCAYSVHRWSALAFALASGVLLNTGLFVYRSQGDPTCPRTRFAMLAWLAQELEGTGIDWFLTYGTLLGAVRNGSIIPWTDDVDICIPHTNLVEEFMKNQKCFNVDYPSTIARMYSKAGNVERFSPFWFWFSEPVYIDVYHLFNCSTYKDPYNCTKQLPPDVDGVYLVGSCHNTSNKYLPWHDVFPINTSGVEMHGLPFPTPRHPEALLSLEYGPTWCQEPRRLTGSTAHGCIRQPPSLAPGPCEGFVREARSGRLQTSLSFSRYRTTRGWVSRRERELRDMGDRENQLMSELIFGSGRGVAGNASVV